MFAWLAAALRRFATTALRCVRRRQGRPAATAKKRSRGRSKRMRVVANGRDLIGSSVNLDAFWNRTRFLLNMRSHGNKQLQQDWGDFGSGAFAFKVFIGWSRGKAGKMRTHSSKGTRNHSCRIIEQSCRQLSGDCFFVLAQTCNDPNLLSSAIRNLVVHWDILQIGRSAKIVRESFSLRTYIRHSRKLGNSLRRLLPNGKSDYDRMRD